MDRATKKSEEFGLLLDAAAASNEVLDARSIKIEGETKLLVEAEDIRDELGILRLVLEDQKTVAEQLDCLLSHSDTANLKDEEKSRADGARDTDFGEDDQAHTLKGNRVLQNHLARIQRMEALATRSIQSVSRAPPLLLSHCRITNQKASRSDLCLSLSSNTPVYPRPTHRGGRLKTRHARLGLPRHTASRWPIS